MQTSKQHCDITNLVPLGIEHLCKNLAVIQQKSNGRLGEIEYVAEVLRCSPLIIITNIWITGAILLNTPTFSCTQQHHLHCTVHLSHIITPSQFCHQQQTEAADSSETHYLLAVSENCTVSSCEEHNTPCCQCPILYTDTLCYTFDMCQTEIAFFQTKNNQLHAGETAIKNNLYNKVDKNTSFVTFSPLLPCCSLLPLSVPTHRSEAAFSSILLM